MRICPTCQRRTQASRCPEDEAETIPVEWLDPLVEEGGSIEESLDFESIVAGRYYLETRIGRGAFADVYRARQLGGSRRVALKLLREVRAESDLQVARFRQEAQALETMSHPNIVDLHDFGETANGRLFIAMEHLEGEPLSDVLAREGALSPERTVRFAIATLEALCEVHARDVTHCDLAPNNLFVVGSRAKETVKLIDFGIARVAGEGEMTLTDDGELLGSPRYMAPEQWKGESVTSKTDIYAVGAVFYRILAGRPVFQKETLRAQLAAVLFEEPSPPEVDGARLEGPLVDVLMACLERDPDDRLEVASALERLEACRDRPITNRRNDAALEVESEPIPALSMDEEDSELLFGNYTPSAEELAEQADGGAGAFESDPQIGDIDELVVDGRGHARTRSESPQASGDQDRPPSPSTSESNRQRVGPSASTRSRTEAFSGSEASDEDDDWISQLAFASLLVSIPLAFAGLGWVLFAEPDAPPVDSRPVRTPPTFSATDDPLQYKKKSPSAESPAVDESPTEPGRPRDAGLSSSPSESTQQRGSPTSSGPSPLSPDVTIPKEDHPSGRRWYLKATQNWLRGRHRKALDQCHRALEVGFKSCHKIVGLIHRDMGNKQKACEGFIKYLETDPADAEAIRRRMNNIGCQ